MSMFLVIFENDIQNGKFKKITITVREVVLIQVIFLNVSYKQKAKVKTRNKMLPSY